VRFARCCFAFGFFAISLLTAAGGQTESDCQAQLDSSAVGRRIETAPGRVLQFASGGAWFSCVGRPGTENAGVVVWHTYSDSVAWRTHLGRADFVGNVAFSDTTSELTSDRASYYQSDDRLEAFDNVRLVNRENGSILTAPHLIYTRASSANTDDAELFADRRPRVEYRTEGDSVAPTIIIGDRVRLLGSSSAWAGGNVEIEKEDFAATGDSATLDLDAESGLLIGHAETVGQDSIGYTLRGGRIAYRMVESELNWVQAQERGEGLSADWRIVGDTIEFTISDSKIQAGMVWGDSIRPRAMSDTYTISADSLAVDLPDQVLTEMRGFGNARATSRGDSASTEVDWIAGDTVVARFDSTSTGARTLTELRASGNARAFYQIYDADDPDLPPGFNYSRGLRIVATFEEETLLRVDVMGEADGIYLEPIRRPQ
jgi:lipopolysaccharide export system protein LptA